VLVLVKQMAARLKRWAIRRKPHPFRRRILRLSFVIALVAGWVFEDWLSHLPVFQVASLRLSEDLLRDAQRRNAVSAQRVTLIEIDEGDRIRFFEDKYPLNAAALAEAVTRVAMLGPVVVVVDVDTDHPSFQGLSRTIASRTVGRANIVWARRLDESKEGKLTSRPVVYDAASDAQLPAGQSSGLAGIGRSLDWSIRRYELGWELAGVGWRRSLPYEAVCQFCAARPQLCQRVEAPCRPGEALPPRSLHHYYSFESLPLHAVYDLTGGPGGRDVLRDSVAILGIPDSPGDMHHTVFGERPGMWLVATAVEQELLAPADLRIGDWQHYPIEFVIALIMVLIHCRFRPQAALLMTLAGLGTLVYYGAWLAVRFAGYDAAVMPFLLTILLEQITRSAEEGNKPGEV
jgi:hypothetical protein